MTENPMHKIQEVSLEPVGRYGDGSPIYKFSTGLPSRGVRALKTIWPSREEAYDDARQAVRTYEQLDRFGNMGVAVGVTPVLEKRETGTHLLGFKGVICTYHSNT